jgi:hypothetical protein
MAAIVLFACGCREGPRARSAADGLIARALPRVTYQGGSFMRHPRIVTVTFARDDPRLVARLERFGAAIATSGWWRTVTAGYCAENRGCLARGRRGRSVRLGDRLPAKVYDVDVGTLLARAARAGRLGPLDSDSLLLVYLSRGVALADAFIARYCDRGARALHRALRLGRTTLPYAVVPRCGGERALTASASQEVVEAATNPDPAARGFAFRRSSANLGFTIAGVEPFDPCGVITMDEQRVQADGYTVQRAWSNRAAARGHDPCLPAPARRPYLALVPSEGTVRLPRLGDTATIALHARSDAPVGGWAVSAIDVSGAHDRRRYVDLSLDKTEVAPGDSARLTMTLRGRRSSGESVVGIVSTLHGHSQLWPVAVVTR